MDCDASICTGGCRHATELFEVEPKFWDEDDTKDVGDITPKRAKELIGEWNDYGRKMRSGCLGILEKKEI
jgi:hypothetical protein